MFHNESRQRARALLAQGHPGTIAFDSDDVERLCRSHPDLADDLRDLSQTMVSDADASGTSWSLLVERLRRHAPSTPRYRVDGVLGSGGMGTVYKVWDETLRRTLAMKVMRPAGANEPSQDARALGRFVEEAQITGQLEHPGIVPVHELGIDDDGGVFFAMRRLSGDELRVDLDGLTDLSGEERESAVARVLGALLKACDAVAYAHSKGVLHRDIKPANIMLGRFGEVYVVDWGLAKVLGSKERHRDRLTPQPDGSVADLQLERDVVPSTASSSILQTLDGSVLGTPAFMPPEQGRGEIDALDETSDVYSMGAVLYNTLTGSPPYCDQVRARSPQSLLRDVLDGPPRPVRDLVPKVSPELNAICSKAMARSPQDRYPNMQALAADLRAFLEHRVVGAYEVGALAEFRKWVRRNRQVAGLGAAIISLVVGTLVTYSWIQRNHAMDIQQQSRKTEGLLNFVTGMLASADPTSGNPGDIRVRDMLDQSSARLAGRFADSPELLADIHEVIETTYASLGVVDKLRVHLEPELALRRELEPGGSERIVRLLTRLAEVELHDDNLDQAQALADEALEMATRVLGSDHWASVSATGTLGAIGLARAGDANGVRPLVKGLVVMAASFHDDGRSHAQLEQHYLALLDDLGAAMERSDEEGVIALLREEVDPILDSGVVSVREIPIAFERGASFLERLGMLYEAEAMLVGARWVAHERLTPPDLIIADMASLFGAFYLRHGRAEAALPLLQEAHDGYREMVGGDPRTFGSVIHLGAAFGALGRSDEQRALLTEAGEQAAAALGTGSGEHVRIVLALASMDTAEGQVEVARDRLLPLVSATVDRAGRRGNQVQTELDLFLATSHLSLGAPSDAREHLERARVWAARRIQRKKRPELYRALLELEIEFHAAVGEDELAGARRHDLDVFVAEHTEAR